jgi:type II secretory pathway pseudopilin PulG
VGVVSRRRRAATLLEALVTISIIAALFAVLAPATSRGREEARVAKCTANLRTIAITAHMYSDDHMPEGSGSYPSQPWYLWPYASSYWYITEYVYGGFQAPREHPWFPHSDTSVIPAEYRPFNKYIDPGAQGRNEVKAFICPSDHWFAAVEVGGSGSVPYSDDRYSAWEVNGNSYAINWVWMEGAVQYGVNGADYMPLETMHSIGSATLHAKVGGPASEFVLFMEAAMNTYIWNARPPGGEYGESPLQQLGMGWHGKHSTYSVAMWDGHVEHRFIDTRYSSGPGYDLWPEEDTAWQCPAE